MANMNRMDAFFCRSRAEERMMVGSDRLYCPILLG